MTRIGQGISIIIAAYQVEEYIEECLDSILAQHWDFRQIEVLVGVDGCEETLKKIKKIKNKYRELRLKVLWFPENSGCYIVSNTLITIAKFDNILTFGADDIMLPDMIKTIMYYSDRYNVIKFKMLNFDHYDRNKTEVYKIAAEGCRFFTKKLFMLVGGYVPWRHTADSEFNTRIRPVLCECYIEKVLFMRRIHKNALTQREETKLGSVERNVKKALIFKNYNNGIIRIPMKINKNYEIMFDLKEYWEKRYKTGGNSGAGSYGEEAQLKAEYINEIIRNYKIQTIQEYGCGDGHNMSMYYGYRQYNGYDIAPHSIELCKANLLINQSKCRFTSDIKGVDKNADLALNLDVLLHQVEDKDYYDLLNLIFKANHMYILLYTPDREASPLSAPHVRYRKVQEDVARLFPNYKLVDKKMVNITEEKYFYLYKL